VFKTFVDAIEKERDEIQYNYTNKQFEINGKKAETFEQEYELINSREFTMECIITYLGKDNFKINFPKHILNKTLD
jgi:NADPH-dependent 7-cyano-7-deazaguanine reductase QueF